MSTKKKQKYPQTYCYFIYQYGFVILFAIISVIIFMAFEGSDDQSVIPQHQTELSTKHYFLLIPIVFLIAYDVFFRLCHEKWKDHGRDLTSVLDGLRAATLNTSFVIGFAGLIFSNIYDNQSDFLKSILEITNKNPILSLYFKCIIIASTLIILFIPVVYTNHGSNNKSDTEPSVVFKNYYFTILLLQKIVIILIVYLGIVFFNEIIKNIN
jgi:hypothetical protein